VALTLALALMSVFKTWAPLASAAEAAFICSAFFPIIPHITQQAQRQVQHPIPMQTQAMIRTI
jgi:hypothetical protein